MNAIHLTKDNFEKEVLKADKPVIVDFWASWCGPCQMMAPVFEELAGDYHKAGTAKLGKLSVEEEQELAAQYGIMSIPTLGIFKNGKIVSTIIGFQPKEQLKDKIDEAISQ